jgi:hypothetical protein
MEGKESTLEIGDLDYEPVYSEEQKKSNSSFQN